MSLHSMPLWGSKGGVKTQGALAHHPPFLRSRCFEFEVASSNFAKIADLNLVKRSDFDLVVELFERWLEKYVSGRFLRLVKDDKYLFIRAINRFMESYRIRLSKKLAFLTFTPFSTLITFTVNPRAFMNLAGEYGWICKSWNRLNSALKRKYGKFFFLRVLEITKKGRPHLHILTTLPFVDVVWMRKLWVKYGGGKQLHIKNTDANGLNYVLKYVTKSMSKTSLLSGAIYFASNRRLFSMNDLRSRSNLDETPKCNSNIVKWVYSGMVREFLLKAFCVENNVTLSDYLVLNYVLGWDDLFGFESNS